MPKEVARSAEALQRILSASKSLHELTGKDPKVLEVLTKELTRYYPTPANVSDAGFYRAIVWFLGLVSIIAISGAVGLALMGGEHPIPDVVTALGSAAIGALAGLLAPTPTKPG